MYLGDSTYLSIWAVDSPNIDDQPLFRELQIIQIGYRFDHEELEKIHQWGSYLVDQENIYFLNIQLS